MGFADDFFLWMPGTSRHDTTVLSMKVQTEDQPSPLQTPLYWRRFAEFSVRQVRFASLRIHEDRWK
jgi:hypothetical protein